MSGLEMERLKYQGRLMEKDLEAKKLAVRIDGLRRSLREELDPFAKVDDLRGDVIASQGMEIGNALIDYRACLEEIIAIKKALGR